MAWFNRLMMSDVGLKMAAREFAGEIAGRVREFEGFVSAGSDQGSDALSRLGNRRSGLDAVSRLGNRRSGLAHMFLEAQVRSLIEERLRPRRLVSGTFSVLGAGEPVPARD
jgi:hypothetical protein